MDNPLVVISAEVFPAPMNHTGAIKFGQVINGVAQPIEAVTVPPEVALAVQKLLTSIDRSRENQ